LSYHKARPEAVAPDPTQPHSTVMFHGREARPHAEIDGKPISGGLHNAIVEGQGRSPKEEKEKIHEYHEKREAVKKAQSEAFDKKKVETEVEKPVQVEVEKPKAEVKKHNEGEK
jgi:hypothetical protein